MLLLTGCTPMPTAAGPPLEAAAGAPTALQRLAEPLDVAQVAAQLARLPVAAPATGEYHRSSYGRRWAVLVGGCGTRDRVLLAQAVGPVRTTRHGSCARDVLAGTWRDSYTGQLHRFTDLKDQHQAMTLSVDHLVPLAEATRSGATRWAPARRLAFANDLHNLLAVDGELNSAKGDDDPAQWLPPWPAARCDYVLVWITVKTRWQLSVDPQERAALSHLLQQCPR